MPTSHAHELKDGLYNGFHEINFAAVEAAKHAAAWPVAWHQKIRRKQLPHVKSAGGYLFAQPEPLKPQPVAANAAQPGQLLQKIPETGQSKTPIKSSLFLRLQAKACSLEFWLGLGAGMVARFLTRYGFSSVLATSHGTPAVLKGLGVCLIAGMAASLATCLVRMMVRYWKGEEPANFARTVVTAIFVGAVSGMLGGIVTDIGACIAQFGNMTISVAAGAATGVPYAVAVNAAARRAGEPKAPFGFSALCGAVAGAMGGMLGFVTASDLSHPVQMTRISQPVDVDASQSAGIVMPADSPAVIAAAEAQAQQALSPAPMPHRAVHMAVAHTVVHHAAHASAHTSHTVAEARHPAVMADANDMAVVRSLNQRELAAINIHEASAAYVQQGMPPSFRQVATASTGSASFDTMQQPPAAPPIAQIINSGVPMDDSAMPKIHGVCADARIACVERVSFNDDGDAVKVVLEPGTTPSGSTHFETARVHENEATPDWVSQPHNAEHGQDYGQDVTQVSLVVPFNRASASMLSAAQPSPG